MLSSKSRLNRNCSLKWNGNMKVVVTIFVDIYISYIVGDNYH